MPPEIRTDERETEKLSNVSNIFAPTAEVKCLLADKRSVLAKIEKSSSTTVTVIKNYGFHLSMPYAVISCSGPSTGAVCDAETQILKHLAKSEKLIEFSCTGKMLHHLQNWKKEQLIHFQKEHHVFVSGGYKSNRDRKKKEKSFSVLAWNSIDLDGAIQKLSQMAGIPENKEKKQKRRFNYAAKFDVLKECLKRVSMRLDGVSSKTRIHLAPSKSGKSETSVVVRSTTNSGLLRAIDDVIKAMGGRVIGREGKDAKEQKAVEKNEVGKTGSKPLALDENKENMKDDQNKKAKPDHLNILVLGETGVGKSTFINGLVNYLTHGSLDKALYQGTEILIRSSFTLYREEGGGDGEQKQFVAQEIVTEPTIQDEVKGRRNEKLEKGQSATQEPRSYLFPMFSEKSGGNQSIRIIDTPGIGDTRGLQHDKKNFHKILQYIAGFEEIHAICILVKPNTARLTLAFRFCIDELLVHLHKSASKNILFCFTNTRGTLYKPGDTLPTLREHLVKLEKERGIKFELGKSTLFSFDNESFRFLCACKDGFPFSELERENFATSWKKSVEETMRLFSRIAELSAHPVRETLCLNNARSVILSLSRPLADISREQSITERVVALKKYEIKEREKEIKRLEKDLYVEMTLTRKVPMSYPRTVCASAKCVDHRRFSADPNAEMEVVYKTVCHEKCSQRIPLSTHPLTQLQQCQAMRGSAGNTCASCGCQWSCHMHIQHGYTESREKVVDGTVKALIEQKRREIRQNEAFISNKSAVLSKLSEDSLLLTAFSTEFASYLSKNAILPFNDSYREYIEQLIKEEREKISLDGPSQLLMELEKCKEEYEQHVLILQKSLASKSFSSHSIDDVTNMIGELQQRCANGCYSQYVKNLPLLSASTLADNRDVVSLNASSSWFARDGNFSEHTRNAQW